MPMSDDPKNLARDRMRHRRMKVLFRFAVPALILVGLAAAVQAQGPPPAGATTTATMAANPVRVADLINLPIVDENKSVMGHVRAVVRTGDGKVQLLLPLGGLFGFGERLVPIPVESLAVTGPQITVTDMPPHRFQKTATWYGSDSETLAGTETVSIIRR
jgi:hypothetical protein